MNLNEQYSLIVWEVSWQMRHYNSKFNTAIKNALIPEDYTIIADLGKSLEDFKNDVKTKYEM